MSSCRMCKGAGVLDRRVLDGINGLVACGCGADPEAEMRRRGYEPFWTETMDHGEVGWRLASQPERSVTE